MHFVEISDIIISAALEKKNFDRECSKILKLICFQKKYSIFTSEKIQ